MCTHRCAALCRVVDFVPLLITFAHEYSFAVVNFDDPQKNTHACSKTGFRLIIPMKTKKNERQPQRKPNQIKRTQHKGGATSAFTQQNMFYTGTNSTMIPFSSDVATAAAVSMGVSNVQSTVRTPPTLWQYPGM